MLGLALSYDYLWLQFSWRSYYHTLSELNQLIKNSARTTGEKTNPENSYQNPAMKWPTFILVARLNYAGILYSRFIDIHPTRSYPSPQSPPPTSPCFIQSSTPPPLRKTKHSTVSSNPWSMATQHEQSDSVTDILVISHTFISFKFRLNQPFKIGKGNKEDQQKKLWLVFTQGSHSFHHLPTLKQ